MKWLIASAVVLLLALAASARSQPRPVPKGPPPDLRLALLEPKDFQIRTHISAIPNPVRAAFARAIGDNEFSLAEPEKAWRVGSEIDNPRLPRRRLQRVLLSESFCVIFYESGGRRKSNHVAIFRLTQDRAEFVGSTGNSSRPIFDPRRLLGAIDKGGVFEWIGAK